MTTDLADRRLPLPDVLCPWIADLTTASVDGEPRGPFTHLPDAATKLVLRTEENGRRDALIVGPRTRASYHALKQPTSCMRLGLTPGTARPLLGVSALDLVGRVVPLGDLPGPTARQLARELARLAPQRVVPHLADVIPDRIAAHSDRSRTDLLRAGIDALSIRTGQVPAQVRDVARDLAVSERQLRNLFAEGVGLSPKHYARIDRVRAVLTHATGVSWAELAAVTGYYDQSHMTSDFRTLMGVPPRSFFTGRLPDAQPCQAFARR